MGRDRTQGSGAKPGHLKSGSTPVGNGFVRPPRRTIPGACKEQLRREDLEDLTKKITGNESKANTALRRCPWIARRGPGRFRSPRPETDVSRKRTAGNL